MAKEQKGTPATEKTAGIPPHKAKSTGPLTVKTIKTVGAVGGDDIVALAHHVKGKPAASRPVKDRITVERLEGRVLSSTGLRLTAVIHAAEEGGYWAEVPALRGCFSQGETLDEVVANIREAAQGWLEVAAIQNPPQADPAALVVELPL